MFSEIFSFYKKAFESYLHAFMEVRTVYMRNILLLGDHRQLQPIVMDPVASHLGLQISLFERYEGRAIMLTDQYRMV